MANIAVYLKILTKIFVKISRKSGCYLLSMSIMIIPRNVPNSSSEPALGSTLRMMDDCSELHPMALAGFLVTKN